MNSNSKFAFRYKPIENPNIGECEWCHNKTVLEDTCELCNKVSYCDDTCKIKDFDYHQNDCNALIDDDDWEKEMEKVSKQGGLDLNKAL